MAGTKKLGIWMDHANAHLTEHPAGSPATTTIVSDFTHQSKEQSLTKGENLMHNKEQHQQGDYYKKLGSIIKNYDEVFLFGPTDAKAELHNILKADHLFSKIKITMEPADKMTEGEQHIFIKEHFAKQL